MMEICKKQDCVGCCACLSACSKDAITMQPDTLGFLYPVIDQNKCIDCALCAESCFNNHKPTYNEPIYTCVGHAIRTNEQVSSASGGLASVFMRTILQKRGVVYGCSGENARNIKHIRIENPNDVDNLKGSKYVQSYLGVTYKNVVADLKANRTVLFVGTPCQIAGLKAYLKDKEYENLYTIDFVCHGVPSQQILNDAISARVSTNTNLRLVNRVKDGGGKSKYTLRLMKDNQIVCDDSYPSTGYITGFLCGLYYRENCYRCQFSRRKRVSDVTLGDFWDRYDNVKGLLNKRDGLSMIIVNTETGKKLLDLCCDSYTCVEWDYDDFIRRNRQLKQPMKRHLKRDLFEKIYLTEGYEAALSKALQQDLINIRKNTFLNAISSIINYTPIVRIIYEKLRNC